MHHCKKSWVDRLGCLSCNSLNCTPIIHVGDCAAAIDAITQCKQVGAICLQYSHDDIIGYTNIHCVTGTYATNIEEVDHTRLWDEAKLQLKQTNFGWINPRLFAVWPFAFSCQNIAKYIFIHACSCVRRPRIIMALLN